MRFWSIILAISVLIILASLIGFAAPALIIPMGLIALIACIYLLRLELRRRRNTPRGKTKWAIIDGSNVMYWKNGEPRIDSVRGVIDRLSKLGFTAGVIFDANAGYLLTGEYEGHDGLSKLLELPSDRVMLPPAGQPADGMILTVARDLGARVVTNDRFRDWAEAHPEIAKPGFLIKGAYEKGKVKLYTDQPAKAS